VLLNLGKKATRAAWQRVASVKKRVHDNLADVFALGEIEAGLEMLEVAVHAAIGDETEKMERTLSSGRLGTGMNEHRITEKAAVGDRGANACQILVDHPAGADVEVTDFAVAHLPNRQTNPRARRHQGAVGTLRFESVEGRRRRQTDGVARACRRHSPTVENDKYDRPIRGLYGLTIITEGAHETAAKRTMRANSCGSRLAPPTSTPSMSA
jgi:hypothetical protein